MHFLFLLVWQRFIFLGWICIFLWCTLIFSFLLWIFTFSNAFSFFLTLLNIFSLIKWLLIFLFLIFPNLIEFLLLMNLHFFSHPSQLEWILYGVSCVFWIDHYFSQFDGNSCTLIFSYFSSFLLVPFLAWWPSLFLSLIVWCFLRILSPLDGFSSLLAWSLSLMNSLVCTWWTLHVFFLNLSHCLHWGSCHVVLKPWGQPFLNMRFMHAYLMFPPNI